MKKLLIVMLSVLLLLSAVSCEEDKTAEVEQNYVDFIDGLNLLTDLYSSFDDIIDDDTDYTTDTIDLAKEKTNPDFTSDFLKRFVETTDKQTIEKTAVEMSGTISGTTKNKEDITFTDTSYTITYDVKEGTSTVKKGEKLTLTLSGHYLYEKNAEDKEISTSITMKLNGTDYDIQMKVDTATAKYKAASVNGRNVNLTLLDNSRV